MDSGSTVPTLKPGFNETVAAKLFTIATGRSCPRLNLGASPLIAGGAGAAGAILLESARFLAADRAGSNNAASTEIMNTTTSSSIRVKPRRGILINHLHDFCT